MSNDEHDGDTTSPDLGVEESTPSGAGPIASIGDSLGSLTATIRSLAGSVPDESEAGYGRHIEVLADALGSLGELGHDTRRALHAHAREWRLKRRHP